MVSPDAAAIRRAPSATCRVAGRNAPAPCRNADRSSATSASYASAGRSASSTTCGRVAASCSTNTCWGDAVLCLPPTTRPTRRSRSWATSCAAADPRPLRKRATAARPAPARAVVPGRGGWRPSGCAQQRRERGRLRRSPVPPRLDLGSDENLRRKRIGVTHRRSTPRSARSCRRWRWQTAARPG